jgi:hypothetical protein
VIRRTIIGIFQRHGSPVPLEGVASEIEVTAEDVRDQLAKQDKLDDLCGLTLKDAFALIEFYGPNVLFTEAITQNVTDAVLTKRKLDRIERRKRDESKPPPTSDE